MHAIRPFVVFNKVWSVPHALESDGKRKEFTIACGFLFPVHIFVVVTDQRFFSAQIPEFPIQDFELLT